MSHFYLYWVPSSFCYQVLRHLQVYCTHFHPPSYGCICLDHVHTWKKYPYINLTEFPCVCVSVPNDLTNRWTDMVLLYSENFSRILERFITILGRLIQFVIVKSIGRLRDCDLWNCNILKSCMYNKSTIYKS